MINVFALDSQSEEPQYSLLGHSENVCALDASQSGLIISGSWDRCVLALHMRGPVLIWSIFSSRTARIWRDFQPLYELRGHEQSVWAVLIVDDPGETYLTGIVLFFL